MTRAALSLLSLAVGAVLTGAIGAARQPLTDANAPASARHTTESSGMIARALAVVATTATTVAHRDSSVQNALQRLKQGAPGTYIADILNERDSSIARWPDREDEPLTIWIQPVSNVADFAPAYVGEVRRAFEDWDDDRIPVHFAFGSDSASAEVHVTWIDHFSEPISGRTRWTRDDDWAITDANIVLAIHHYQGELLDGDSMHAMALHEIGHLLGLDHTRDSTSIMAPKVRVRQLSDADRATVHLLYELPAGPLH